MSTVCITMRCKSNSVAPAMPALARYSTALAVHDVFNTFWPWLSRQKRQFYELSHRLPIDQVCMPFRVAPPIPDP